MVSDINGLCDIAVYDISGLYEIAVCVMLQFLTSRTGFLAYLGLYYVMLHNFGNCFFGNLGYFTVQGLDDRSLKIFKMKKFVLCGLGFCLIYCFICIIQDFFIYYIKLYYTILPVQFVALVALLFPK